MKEYRIISGEWSDLNHDNGRLYVKETENGIEVQKFYYGFNFADEEDAPIHKQLCAQIKSGEVELQDNINALRIAGLAPLAHNTILKDGVIYDKDVYRQMVKDKIKNRINELYSGYNILRAEKNPAFKRNWKRKLDNLLNAEESGDLLNLDIDEVEDAEGE